MLKLNLKTDFKSILKIRMLKMNKTKSYCGKELKIDTKNIRSPTIILELTHTQHKIKTQEFSHDSYLRR